MQIRFLVLGFLCAASTVVYAVDIYRWVDERGQQQMADRVPEKYRDVAVKINSRRFELTPEQQRESDGRASQESDRIAKAKAEREAKEQRQRQLDEEAAALAKTPAATGQQAASKPPKNCNDQWREFWEKTSCYLPYRNTNGSLRPGWEQICKDMQSPAPVCQIPTIP
jgi:hypothetical protein